MALGRIWAGVYRLRGEDQAALWAHRTHSTLAFNTCFMSPRHRGMGEEREKDARQSIAMARVIQSGQEDQALVPRMALSSTTRRWLLVRLSICGLRIPQRLGAGEGRGPRVFRKLRTEGLRVLIQESSCPPLPTPARPFSLLYLDSILVNLLI